jgi:hypothetical protein
VTAAYAIGVALAMAGRHLSRQAAADH